jgi:hypothetical protein
MIARVAGAMMLSARAAAFFTVHRAVLRIVGAGGRRWRR